MSAMAAAPSLALLGWSCRCWIKLDLARVLVYSDVSPCPAMLSLRAFSSIALGVLVWAGCRVCSVCSSQNLNLDKVDAILNLPASADGQPRYVDEGDLRDALRICVAAVNADASNRVNAKRLQNLLQLVTDYHQRFKLFEDAARGLLDAGNREAAGLLGTNLAESMDRDGRGGDLVVQEALFNHSIHIFPECSFAARSLGYRLEQRGEEQRAIKLYRECWLENPGRLDLRLLLASACSPFLEDAYQGDLRFSRVSSEMRRLVYDIQTAEPPYRNVPSPGRDLGYIPSFSWQYMGRNMRPLMEALCWVLAAMSAGLHDVAPKLHPFIGWDASSQPVGHEGHTRPNRKGQVFEQGHPSIKSTPPRTANNGKIVIGVVMERQDNHSPHRLIQGVVEGIDRSRFRVVAFARDGPESYPAAGQAVLHSANEVLILPWHPFVNGMPDPFAERKVVTKAQVDVLFYMALGNTLGSHLLALGRLAPVQISFGHGHPVTSGSPGIDYFVSSDLFETAVSIDAREARRFAGTSSDIAVAAANIGSNGTSVGAPTPLLNTVQKVTSSLPNGGRELSLQPRAELGKEKEMEEAEKERRRDPSVRGRGDGTQDYSEQLVLFDSLTASLPEAFGPANSPDVATRAARASSGLLREEDHAYHCIQHSKKFHPDFDRVLRGVLLGDPAAKIILTASSKIHLPRWKKTLGLDLVPRLVFLPYLPHPEMLMVVANCRVMLDTFPWGAGVTSMEALSFGVPVVTLPARMSVLQLAAGQLIALGAHEGLVASNIDDMVTKAIKLASDSSYRDKVSAVILGQKDRLSDPRRAVEEWERFFERAVRSAITVPTVK